MQRKLLDVLSYHQSMPEIPIEATSARYSVLVDRGLLSDLAKRIRAKTKHISAVFLVTSPEIDALWGAAVRDSFRVSAVPVHTLHVPAGEQHKRLGTLERLGEQMAQLGADRDALLLAVGGGVIGDITGFLAAVYMRGIRYVQVPTTLLAQVDSSVGGKTGVNLAAGKNLVGSFHHPVAVFADVDTLATLPERELRAGLQESVKAAILRDPELFAFMESHVPALLAGDPEALLHVVERSVQIKADVVAEDEYEAGVRMILNLGHTVGHAIEAATNYTTLLHGEAIGWGMVAALRLAEARHAIAVEDARRIEALIHRCTNLPLFEASAADLVSMTAADKKNRSGTRSFILPTGIGTVEIVRDVSDSELLSATKAMLDEMHQTTTARRGTRA